MDKALDEVIGDRQRESKNKGGRNRRHDNWPRDGARKNSDSRNNIDDDWIHDKYEDNDDNRGPSRQPRSRIYRNRESPQRDLIDQGAKLRVENLHYDLTEDDLEDLFLRIAPVTNLTLTYDRAGRSTGTAYVTYQSMSSARSAIREFDGANANGQPIRLSLVPLGPSGRGGRNPFDSASKPGRSLFDRIEGANKGRDRSRSPRRSDVSKPPPEGIDRYVPGERSRSPPRRRRVDRRDGGSGSRRGEGSRRGGPRRDDATRPVVGNRPRMTQEELDKDMDDYWNSKQDKEGIVQPVPAAVISTPDDDIDMAE